MRFTDEESPSIGSYWKDANGKRFRVMIVTNLRSKQPDEYPVMVAYRDVENHHFSLPLERFKSTLTWIPPSPR